jgi:hypothetical protein
VATRSPVSRTSAYLSLEPMSTSVVTRVVAFASLVRVGWGVGVVVGSGVSADAQAYFGTRPGLAPGRRHDV